MRLLLSVLILAAGLMSACSGSDERPSPTAAPTTTLAPTATLSPQTTALPSIAVQAKAGENFTARLDSNRTTGYSWRLARPLDERLVKLAGSVYEAPAAPLPGAGGKEAWTFTALAKGRTNIVLEYLRPFDQATPPARMQTLEVVIE